MAESFKAERQEINGTPLPFADDRSVASLLTGLAGGRSVASLLNGLVGASVASECVEAPSRKKRPYNWVEGVERDYKGKIIRKCGIEGCQYKANEISNMKKDLFKKILRKKIKDLFFYYLQNIKNGHSKVQQIVSKSLKMQDYLTQFEMKDAQLLFKLRSRMIDVRANLRSYYQDISCKNCTLKIISLIVKLY